MQRFSRNILTILTIKLYSQEIMAMKSCLYDKWIIGSSDNCDWINDKCEQVDYRVCHPTDDYNCQCNDTLRKTINKHKSTRCRRTSCPKYESKWGSWHRWTRLETDADSCIRTRDCLTGGKYSRSWSGCYPVTHGKRGPMKCWNRTNQFSHYAKYFMGTAVLVFIVCLFIAAHRMRANSRHRISGVIIRSTRYPNDCSSRTNRSRGTTSRQAVQIATISNGVVTDDNSHNPPVMNGRVMDDSPPDYNQVIQSPPSYSNVVINGEVNTAYRKD